ncbi:putative PurR-regulated permease PerM [Variovorax boronicumulans]|uniref:PurR-regulated permease PerM n=1 Tax=Variovorax boronicumulans TaxID=436515 RepID=A0AAW8CYZ6_9BURK|nr:AI-2E family transporter [Variovorax boronicumulans]MDP9892917.1 putative PurR-regulated permease PerM [Variovorax boronicumulans]MDQ0041672.1 putative PurR-regulated permease PerM [Variovorax boronicumulans]MDQ0052736.1 putative PurR-regulated permease PerM [Variovorax boronicumulans]
MTDEHKPPASDKPQPAEAPQPTPEPPAVEPPATPSPVAPAPEAAAAPEEPAAEPTAAQRRRLMLHMPVDVRSASLVVLAVLASVFALQWGQAVFIPLMLSLLLTYALSPLVELLHRWHLPRWIGAAFILVGLFGGIGWTGYSLSGNASQLVDSLPVAAQKLGQAMRRDKGASATPLESVQQAAAQLEKAAEENSARVASRRGVARVIIERPGFNVRDYLLSGTVGLLSALGQFTLVAFLTYFALCSGDTFRRKLIKITGSSLQKKKVTVHVLDDITRNIERYLLVQIFTSVLVGLATGLAFWAIGLENAAVWGIIAAVTNLIPYIGSVIVLAAAGLVAFLQFNSLQMGLAVAGTSLAIHTIIGNLLLPWLTSRTSRMNPVAVFVGVIFWGWLWGIWGLLLGIPITMVIKSICDRVEDLQPIGELLGE